MDSQHNLERTTPSKSLLNTVHNKFAHSAFNAESPFKRLATHSTPPSRYTKVKNPFETHLAERLHTHFFSPSVFKVSSPKMNEKFQWTIEEISSFYPADIDEAATGQYESHEHDSVMESTAQAKIDLFFSEGVVPSPVNQQIQSTPLITETPAKNAKRTCDGVAQTVLSLPIHLPEEVENALRPYFNQGNHNEGVQTDTSLHKILFDTEESESVRGSIDSSPPHSIDLSPIAPPNQCDLDSRFHSPFKLGHCNLSPIGAERLGDDDRKCNSRLDFSGHMSVDNSFNIVPDATNQMTRNESINFDTTNSPQREVLSDSTVHWEMEYKHICTDTPNKKREMDASNSNTPKSKIFTSQRKKLSDSFLREEELSDKENNVSIEEYDEESAYLGKTAMQETIDAGYHTGVMVSGDISWSPGGDTNLFASTPTRSKK